MRVFPSLFKDVLLYIFSEGNEEILGAVLILIEISWRVLLEQSRRMIFQLFFQFLSVPVHLVQVEELSGSCIEFGIVMEDRAFQNLRIYLSGSPEFRV